MILIIGGTHQGKSEYAKTTFPKMKYIFNLHEIIREKMQTCENNSQLDKYISDLLQLDDVVITCDEVGNGIVPMERFERNYREAVGRSCCKLASSAETVIQVCCGIGRKIK